MPFAFSLKHLNTMEILSVKTQGVKGKSANFKENVGFGSLFLGNGDNRISIDVFEGSGNTYKRRECELIEIYSKDRIIFSGTMQELENALTNDKKTINVKTFIKSFGIENLNHKTVEQNGKKYKIELSKQDLEYHSINNPDWGGSKERLDKYHDNGNFRFYAIDENQMCIWVYPTTDLLIDN